MRRAVSGIGSASRCLMFPTTSVASASARRACGEGGDPSNPRTVTRALRPLNSCDPMAVRSSHGCRAGVTHYRRMRVLSHLGAVIRFVQLFARMLVCMDVRVCAAVIVGMGAMVPGRVVRVVMRTLHRADPVLETR